jgi:rod shape-determining protein MreD
MIGNSHNNPQKFASVFLAFKIVSSLSFAAILLLLPMADWIEYIKPDFIFLMVLFWVYVYPKKVGLIFAWISGLFADAITGNSLGINATIYLFGAACIIYMDDRLRKNTDFMRFSVIYTIFFIAYIVNLIFKTKFSFIGIFFQSLSGVSLWMALVVLFNR